ncbi:MAG: helicase, partial [Muribaculaceae bacterium]|nr:helicase [Muribaculaceae bacterium]
MNQAITELLRQRALLSLEYESEKTAFSLASERIGISRLAERGNAWWPVRFGRCYYNSINQRVVEIIREEDTDADHNFEFGRPVAFFTIDRRDGDKPVFPFTGSVS